MRARGRRVGSGRGLRRLASRRLRAPLGLVPVRDHQVLPLHSDGIGSFRNGYERPQSSDLSIDFLAGRSAPALGARRCACRLDQELGRDKSSVVTAGIDLRRSEKIRRPISHDPRGPVVPRLETIQAVINGRRRVRPGRGDVAADETCGLVRGHPARISLGFQP